jgi:hypothetical protein
MSEEFFLVLPSNASPILYPDNKVSAYTVLLPHPIDLGPNWLVTLSEISYTKSWFNVQESNIVMEYVDGIGDKVVDDTHKLTLPGGYYHSPEDFVKTINKTMQGWERINGVNAVPEYVVEDRKFKIRLTDNGVAAEGEAKLPSWGYKRKFNAAFEPQVEEILGIANLPAQRPIHLNQGWGNIYVYSDIVEESIVGDVTAPLLRVIGTDTQAPFGTQITISFDDEQYRRVSHHSFQEISIYLANDQGKRPHFHFGRVTVTLKFKPA